jgi:hypothetical protein
MTSAAGRSSSATAQRSRSSGPPAEGTRRSSTSLTPREPDPSSADASRRLFYGSCSHGAAAASSSYIHSSNAQQVTIRAVERRPLRITGAGTAARRYRSDEPSTPRRIRRQPDGRSPGAASRQNHRDQRRRTPKPTGSKQPIPSDYRSEHLTSLRTPDTAKAAPVDQSRKVATTVTI